MIVIVVKLLSLIYSDNDLDLIQNLQNILVFATQNQRYKSMNN